MSKMSELAMVLDELAACGEKLTETARAIRRMFMEAEEPEQTQEQPAQAEPEEKKYTFTEVRKAFSAKSHAGYTEQIRSLIGKYGADKLSAVKEEDYPALMAELEAMA